MGGFWSGKGIVEFIQHKLTILRLKTLRPCVQNLVGKYMQSQNSDQGALTPQSADSFDQLTSSLCVRGHEWFFGEMGKNWTLLSHCPQGSWLFQTHTCVLHGVSLKCLLNLNYLLRGPHCVYHVCVLPHSQGFRVLSSIYQYSHTGC